MSNKIKSILIENGYSLRSFCKETGIDYDGFTRRIRLNIIKQHEIETIAILCSLTQGEVIEFFFPKLFEKIKNRQEVV